MKGCLHTSNFVEFFVRHCNPSPGICPEGHGKLDRFPFVENEMLRARENSMNYYGGKELAESFRTVRNNTLAIAEDIPEDKYSFRPMPDTRNVGELLAHIALSQGFQQQIHAKERRTSLVGF